MSPETSEVHWAPEWPAEPMIYPMTGGPMRPPKPLAAIGEGELKPGTSTAPVLQFVLGKVSALAAISRSAPTQTQLNDVLDYILDGLPWTDATRQGA